jgi:hypothetical protein
MIDLVIAPFTIPSSHLISLRRSSVSGVVSSHSPLAHDTVVPLFHKEDSLGDEKHGDSPNETVEEVDQIFLVDDCKIEQRAEGDGPERGGEDNRDGQQLHHVSKQVMIGKGHGKLTKLIQRIWQV